MFNKLIDWAVTNRLLVVIALTTLIVSAVFVIPKLNLDAFPDVTNVQVSVNTSNRSGDVCLTGCDGSALYFQNRSFRCDRCV